MGIAANNVVAGMQTGHERGARRSAHGAAGVKAGEADALGRQFVEVWSLNSGLAVAADIPITQVVRQDKQDIGPARGRRAAR